MAKKSVTASNLRLRKSFAKNSVVIDIPNLILLQKKSYEDFLQKESDFERRDNTGLEGVFKSVFPITDFNRTSSLEFVGYTLEPPKYDVDECRQRGMTFASPLKVTLRLIVFDIDEATESHSVRDVKEQEVYLGEIPLMTTNGSFIINGTERVVVSQLHRSPGVFFDHDGGKGSTTGKYLYSARVIPYRGSWLDFEFDQKDLLYCRIDRRRKFPVTVLLKALGYNEEELLNFFYDSDRVVYEDGSYFRDIDIDSLAGQRALSDIKHPESGKVLVKEGRRVTRAVVRKMKEANLERIEISSEDMVGKTLAKPIIDFATGEIIADINSETTPEVLEQAITLLGVNEFSVIFFDGLSVGPYLRNTLLIDKVSTKQEALIDIYKRLRPGEPPTIEAAEAFFNKLFFDPETYDLSEVGRLKINHRFNFDDKPIDKQILTNDDIMYVVKTMIDLKNGQGQVDDIDHLGNRRVRSVGELLENQYRVGLVRMERSIKERMSLQDLETMMPHDLINAKPVNAVVKEFFGSSQLSQFMDQTNPLSEITHKRRLSALGPGGLTRDRAGFEVRDVHPTHYGRICPIETPEGPNIGLIASLATYARINKHGFIETPYRSKLTDAKISPRDQVYVSSYKSLVRSIAQVDKSDKKNQLLKLTQDKVNVRHDGEYEIVDKERC